MKQFLLLFPIALSAFLPVHSNDYISPSTADLPPSPQLIIEDIALNELEELELLIEVGEDNIIQQKILLSLLGQYQKSKNALMEGFNTDERVLEAIKNAKYAWQHMQKHHLSYLFHQDYLKELKVFARVEDA